MEKFNNVSVLKNANIYFGGNVTSRTVIFADGSKKTLGIMMPGSYQFGASENELMEITNGDVEILLAGKDKWETIKSGGSFRVDANTKFDIKVNTVTDYCCSYS